MVQVLKEWLSLHELNYTMLWYFYTCPARNLIYV